ncbi:MAG: hypothetical protein P4L44_15385 [Oryzomonas sp.]|uniref:hypothetical protein n=1 Tax=Oryzomonas sp. TaxID=2855186 RepID=UPI002844B704|nr:hypothetical protein [Oryzomonas sp.]MDR3581342.1 hypothetical protein [Oryzomonas sp.]
MRNVFVRLLVVSALAAAACAGCSRKEQRPAQASQQKKDVIADPRDEIDVVPVRDRVLEHYKAGNFEAIYQEASKGFRQVGQKEQFVALWKNQLEQTGAIKDFKETGHGIRPADKFLIFTYHVQYEKMPKELRMIFGRSDAGKMQPFGRSNDGKMELTGIHQTDNNKNK